VIARALIELGQLYRELRAPSRAPRAARKPADELRSPAARCASRIDA